MARMRVSVFATDYFTGKLLGAVDVAIQRAGADTLLVSGNGMKPLVELAARLMDDDVSTAVFSLVTDEAEYKGCRSVAIGSVLRVDFKSERRR